MDEYLTCPGRVTRLGKSSQLMTKKLSEKATSVTVKKDVTVRISCAGFMGIMLRKYHLDGKVQLPAVPGQKPPSASPVMSPVFPGQIQPIF